MLKKNIYRYILLFCLLCITGCSYHPINEINRLVNKSSRFTSISINRVGGVVVGKLWMKDNSYAKGIVAWFKGDLDLLRFDRSNNRWVYFGYTSINLNDKRIETIDIYTDKNPKVEKYTMPKNLKLFNRSVWEDTPRGVAIQADRIQLKYIAEKQFDSNFWKCYEGLYDLSNESRTRPLNEGRKGKLVLWWSVEDRSCVEIYMNDLEVPVIMRRMWLDYNFKEELDSKDPQSINDFFLNYAKLASFNEFYDEFTRLKEK